MNLIKIIEKEIEKESAMLSDYSERLKAMPDYSKYYLTRTVSNNTTYYWLCKYINGKLHRKYLGQANKRVRNIQLYKFLEKGAEALKSNISAMNALINTYSETDTLSIVNSLAKAYQSIDCNEFEKFNNADRLWMHKMELQKNRRPHPIQIVNPIAVNETLSVRSKSEALIAIKLIEAGIPFVYECPLELPDGRIIYPDFIIFLNNIMFIWEHLGDMYADDYFHKYFSRLNDYKSLGYIPMENLFLTFEKENGKLNVTTIDNTIHNIKSMAGLI